MTFLIIPSLMIAQALAQTQTQDQQTQTTESWPFESSGNTLSTANKQQTRTQDQQTQTTGSASVAASDKTPSTIVATEKAGSGKKVVIGNKDTKGYCLSGMPCYNKVNKNHRIYFKSEEQAIAEGYHKAGTGKNLTGRVSPAGGETIKNQSIPIAADSAASEKSSPKALQKNEKILETKAQETPKTVEEPQKLSDENIQKKPVNKETVTDEPKDINQKLQDLQNQVDTLKELGRTREKLTATKEEKEEQEKSVLTAVGREYSLMQKGKFELDYSLGYSYISSTSILTSSEVEPHANDTITNGISVSYGLRNNVTANMSLSYVYVYDKTGGSSAKENSDLGDTTLSLNYQPFKSGGNWPATTITMAVILPTGRSPYEINRDTDLPTGGGLYGVSLGVNMSKSIDPATAFGGIGCTYRLKPSGGLAQNINGAILDDIDPGMSFSASVGLAYAISYALSMNVAFQYGYNMDTDYYFTNNLVSTSPAFSTASLVVGAGWRVSPETTLSFSLSIGLTKDDPDFSFSFRLPFSF
jgi:hypothetical protein